MTLKRPALGRGLGALIDDSKYEKKTVEEVISSGSITEIEIDKIEVNPFQPRTDFDEEALLELSVSIRELGIIQPITVRKIDNDKFQIISGERRFRASKLAGLTALPAFVRDVNDQSMLELALVENIQREDLNAIEVAITYQRLIDECSLTQESLSERIGKKRSTITNYLRLLKLPVELQAGIRDKLITFGHARALITIEDAEKQLALFNRAIEESLSVREVEKLVREINNPTPVVVEEPKQEPVIEPIQEVVETQTQEIIQEETHEVAQEESQQTVQEEDYNENTEDVLEQMEQHEIETNEVENVIDNFLTLDNVEVAPKKTFVEPPLPEHYVHFKDRLSYHFQIGVDVKRDEKGKGRLVIPFNSDDEFNRIAEILKKLD